MISEEVYLLNAMKSNRFRIEKNEFEFFHKLINVLCVIERASSIKSLAKK